MGKHPDKIFRDKLSGYQRPAPESAWNRIESNVQSKRRATGWMKIAAAVLFLIVSGYLIMQENVFIKTTESNDPSIVVHKPVEPQINVDSVLQSKRLQQERIEQIDQRNIITEKNIVSRRDIEEKPSSSVRPEKVIAQTSENNLSDDAVLHAATDTVLTGQIAIAENSSTTIIYSSEEVEKRFLRKKEAVKKPVTKSKVKPAVQSGILAGTKTMKNDPIGLGDLRQLKDDFFSFDFLAQNDSQQKK